jgi:hypothetical protein
MTAFSKVTFKAQPRWASLRALERLLRPVPGSGLVCGGATQACPRLASSSLPFALPPSSRSQARCRPTASTSCSPSSRLSNSEGRPWAFLPSRCTPLHSCAQRHLRRIPSWACASSPKGAENAGPPPSSSSGSGFLPARRCLWLRFPVGICVEVFGRLVLLPIWPCR